MSDEVQMQKVSSGNIREVGFHASYLLVRFASGGLFSFKGVPRAIYEAMLTKPWSVFRDRVMGDFIGIRVDYTYPSPASKAVQ